MDCRPKTQASPRGEVDAYIAGFPAEKQTILNAVRAVICETAAEAEERLSYGMPGYYWHGPVAYFAMAKNHLGFYPTPAAIEHFGQELAGYKTSKGAVQFPLGQPVPMDLIRRMVRFKLAENANQGQAHRGE